MAADALHVHRVEVLDVPFHAVDEHQRAASVDGVPTADVERGGLAGTAGARRDVQARDGALQHVAHVEGGAVLEFIGLHHGHGAREVGLLLGAVAHDHGIFQDVLVLFEHHQDLAASLDGNLLRQITPDDGAVGIRDGTAHCDLLGVRTKRDGHTEEYDQYAEQFLG